MKGGWVAETLGAMTTKIGSGATPRGGEECYKLVGISLIRSLNVYDDGFRAARLAKIDDEQAARLSHVVVEPNDVLFNITGASVARCCLAPAQFMPARVNQHVAIIRPIAERLDPAFLRYLLISSIYKERLLQTGEAGSTRQAITKAQLQELAIEFPESLVEQQRIAGILDEAFEGIATARENAERNLRNARALFEGHRQSVLTQRGEGWDEELLGDVCSFQRGLTYTRGDKVDLSGNVVLRAMNIDLATHLLDFSDLRYISDDVVVPQSKKVREGSLMICTASGSKSHLGKIAYIDDDYGYAFGGFMGMLTPKGRLVPRYLFHLMTSTAYEQFIGALADGMNINNLKFDDLSQFRVCHPSLSEQQRIVEKLDTLAAETQRLENVYQRKLAALDELEKSLLREAFAGQLTTEAA